MAQLIYRMLNLTDTVTEGCAGID